MKKLITGLQAFRTNYVASHRELLESLAHGQHPRVLFITCSDSRIDPNLLTQTDVGELFTIRNAGNIVPPYRAANGGEGASIEYAIQALGIEQIVVCGHSHCGAMKGLLQLGKLEEQMPLVYDWLKHAEATRLLVKENYSTYSGEELLEITIAENVLTQIENLKTYPIVHSRLYQGKLKIYGWIYLLETGEVLAYDIEKHAYIAPQSQLDYEEAEGKPMPGRYANTQAPPVACELPPTDEIVVASAGVSVGVGTPGKKPEPAPNGSKANYSNSNYSQPAESSRSDRSNSNDLKPDHSRPWLSPEQADRIYRGSSSKERR
jgi:carbonic anhydrase